MRYTNSSVAPSNLTRTVTFRVTDGTDNSNTQSRNISVTGTNIAPVLASIEGSTLAYTEGDGPVNITGTITATDADNANLASAVITISANYQNGEDVLSFTTCQWHNRRMECSRRTTYPFRQFVRCQLQVSPPRSEIYKQQRYSEHPDPHGHLQGVRRY